MLLLAFMLGLHSGCTYLSAPSLNSYLEEVADIQQESDSALKDINTHLSDLSGEPAQVEKAVAELQSDREAVDNARQSIEALETPDDALPLRDDLLALYTKGTELFDELITSGNYSLEFEPLRKSYEAAANKFSDEMAAAPGKDRMLLSLRSYGDSVRGISERARKLKPAVTSQQSHRRFLDDLDTLSAGLAELQKAIESNDTAAVQAASERLGSSSPQSQEMKQAIDAARTNDIRATTISSMNSLP